MTEQEILSEKPINMVQVREELQKIQKREKELNYRANKTFEYLKSFVKLNAKEAEEIYDKIQKLNIPRLKDMHIHKIIDLMPAKPEELKVILQGYTITVTQENMKKITDIVAKYLPKKKK